MKKCGLSAVVVLLVAGSSQAVGGVSLDLTLIGRNAQNAGNPPWSAVSNSILVNNATASQTVRFEVRFSLHDSVPNDNITFVGLAGSAFDLRSTFTASSGASITFGRFQSSDDNDGAPARDGPVNFDSWTGVPRGLVSAYRPNIGNSGRLGTAPDGNLGTLLDYPVIPLSISTPANTPVDGDRYQLYAFNIIIPTTVAAGTYTVRLANIDQAGIYYAIDNPNSGTELGVFPFDVSASSSSTVSVTVIPAPGSAAVLGLGGLLAARRRRN